MAARSHIRSGLIAALAATVVLHGLVAHADTSAETDARPVSSPTVVDESQVKAAFLYNFIKFIEWPQNLFADAQSPYVIGVLSRDLFSTELERLTQGRNINGRSITIRIVGSADQALGVHMLFVGAGDEARFAALQPRLSGAPIVLVGESADFVRSGGTIGFVLQDAKMRFEIRADLVERAGVRISAQLQKLATTVRRPF